MSEEDLEAELSSAKTYLCSVDDAHDDSLYDRLSSILARLLTERPPDGIGSFNELCQQVHWNQKREGEELKPISGPMTVASMQLLDSIKELYKIEDPETKIKNDFEVELPNLVEEFSNWEQIGVGMTREEISLVFVSMRNLAEETSAMCSVRFWGKIFGLERNYYVLECEVKDEGGEPEKDMEDEGEEDEDHDEVTLDLDKIPKPKYDKPVIVPKEEEGRGCNRNSYFVCNDLGGQWHRLPSVQPIHITEARKIKKFFTGNLNSEVNSSPPFHGSEMHYLRAQIARITAGTQISPLGGYVIDEDEEEENDGPSEDQKAILNSEFEMQSTKELLDLSNWVHHVRYILPQGRSTWWSERKVEEADEEQVDENPEVGPPLLTPLSEDSVVEGICPWITRQSSDFVQQHSIASVHSCLWWGAHAFANSRSFENIYIGWGLKSTHRHFVAGKIMQEFEESEEIIETDDPTPQQERAANEDFDLGNPAESKEFGEDRNVEYGDEEEEEEDD